MSRHTTSGRWQLGLGLALITMLAWATLPVALKLSLEFIDPWTLTWFRFLTAASLVFLWLARRQNTGGRFRAQTKQIWWMLLAAALGLIGNYVFYLLGLALTGPAVAQIVIQLAPLLMGLGGIVFFGERYTHIQRLGFAALLLGLGFFFHHQLAAVQTINSKLWLGAGYLTIAAISWASYALAQKQLLFSFSSARIMLFIYVFASLSLLPTATFSTLLHLNLLQWLLLIYCALNTIVAYGAFAEALNHWEASRVSAVLALTPLGTFLVAMLVSWQFPEYLAPEHLDILSWAGAIIVVLGSIVISLASRANTKNQTNPGE